MHITQHVGCCIVVEHKPAQSSTDPAPASNGQANWPDPDLLPDLIEPWSMLDLPPCRYT